jgi:hypothetical protein
VRGTGQSQLVGDTAVLYTPPKILTILFCQFHGSVHLGFTIAWSTPIVFIEAATISPTIPATAPMSPSLEAQP